MRRRDLIRWLGAAVLGVAAADYALRSDGDEGLEVRSAPTPTPTPADTPTVASPRTPPVPEVHRAASPEAPATTSTAPVASAGIEVLCRDAWGARPPDGSYREHRLERLTVHHTAVVQTDPTQGPSRVRQHQRHHLDSGFVDLAYHHLIDREGNVYEGRPVTAPGETFTDYDPTGHYLPCLEGNLDEQSPTPAQLEALVDLLAWAAGAFGVAPGTIAGHRAYASTSCPGDALQRLLDDGTLRRRVEERLAAGPPDLALLCGDAGRQRVAAIERA